MSIPDCLPACGGTDVPVQIDDFPHRLDCRNGAISVAEHQASNIPAFGPGIWASSAPECRDPWRAHHDGNSDVSVAAEMDSGHHDQPSLVVLLGNVAAGLPRRNRPCMVKQADLLRAGSPFDEASAPRKRGHQ